MWSVSSLWKSALGDPMDCSLPWLLCPWNSPGKNTEVGSCFLLQGNLPNPGIASRSPTLPAYSLPSEPPRKPENNGTGGLSLLQGIFLTKEWNQGLLHCRPILYQLSYQGSPTILRWVAYPFSRGSSWPRNHTGVSCIADGFFASWATCEARKQP